LVISFQDRDRVCRETLQLHIAVCTLTI